MPETASAFDATDVDKNKGVGGNGFLNNVEKKLQYWHGLASLTPINGRSYGFIGSTLDPNSMPKNVVLICLLHSCMVL